MVILVVLAVIIVLFALVCLFVCLFLNQPSFGRLPRGERLVRIERSPNFKDGEFKNECVTPMLTNDENRIKSFINFLFKKDPGLRPDAALQVVKSDIRHIKRDSDFLIWFGHSSYFMQLEGKRILVDPVFYVASPVSFINKPFKGTDVYYPEDMPDIDYLIITHDHWDHLDYKTIVELRPRIGKVICALGVGEHFEYWKFDKKKIVELDWNENESLDPGLTVHCLPARHFSGRGLTPNRTLWASFLLETPSQKIYIGGDGGYDSRFEVIGERFPNIDLAILENGQYNDDWKYIHLMPQYMSRAAKDLKAKKILTVHHSKYALSKHRWDEPLKNARNMQADSLDVLIPRIGEVVNWHE